MESDARKHIGKILLLHVVFIGALGSGFYGLAYKFPEYFGVWLVLLLAICVGFGTYIQPRLTGYPTKIIAKKMMTYRGQTIVAQLEVIERHTANRYSTATVRIFDYRAVFIDERGQRLNTRLLGHDEAEARKVFVKMG